MKRGLPITVTSLNTWSGVAVSNREATIVDYIVELAHTHDIVSLNEVHYADDTGKVPRFGRAPVQKDEIGPYHLTLGNEVREKLFRTHELYFTSNFECFAYHDRAAAEYPVKFGNLLIVRRKRLDEFSLRDQYCYGQGGLNTEVLVKGMVVNGIPASRSMQVCSVLCGNHRFRLVFMHGIWTQRGKVDCPARVSQNARIGQGVLAATRNTAYETAPTILMGDLNYTSRLECFKDLLQHKDVFNGTAVNLNAKAGITTTRTKFYTRYEPEADFTLMSDWAESYVDTYEVLDAPSDHMRLRLVLGK